MNKKKHIVSFSGGKDSTCLLLLMIEKKMPIDRVICVDTTKEFPAMYSHIKKVQEMIKPEIEIVKIDFDYWFGEHLKTKGKNKGKRGYGWPDFRSRWCTSLKREAFLNTVASVKHNPRNRKRIEYISENIIEYHGISFDEKNRINKNRNSIKYPLVDWKITGKQALQYCYDRGLNWNGLYEKFNRVSCFCCPLSRMGEFRTVYTDFPELWKKIQKMDKKSFRKVMKNYTVKELTQKFEREVLTANECIKPV